MKHRRCIWLVMLLAGLVLMGLPPQNTRAEVQQGSGSEQAVQTPAATEASISPEIVTPELRQLPPVGGNAGLVIAGSVLVLIILVGVMFRPRWKGKH
jgi:hypothetical protein